MVSTVMWVVRRMRRFLSDSRHIVFLSRACSTSDDGMLPAEFSWSCVRSGDDFYRSKLSSLSSMRKKFLKRITRGDYCFFVQTQDALAFFVWCTESFMHLPEIGWRSRLDEKTAYLYHADTLDTFRGRGVLSAMDAIICRYLAERGISRALAVIDKENVAVLVAHAKAGFVPVTDMRAYSMFGIWSYQPSKKMVISMLR